jgi:hypothetical protein
MFAANAAAELNSKVTAMNDLVMVDFMIIL